MASELTGMISLLEDIATGVWQPEHVNSKQIIRKTTKYLIRIVRIISIISCRLKSLAKVHSYSYRGICYFKGMARTTDMTKGNPMKHIVRFTIPLFLGNVFQQLYNMADSAIVGQKLGVNALTSVGASASITFLIIGFCTQYSIGESECLSTI